MKPKVKRHKKASKEDRLIDRIATLVSKEIRHKGVDFQAAFQNIVKNNPDILEGLDQIELETIRLKLPKSAEWTRESHLNIKHGR